MTVEALLLTMTVKAENHSKTCLQTLSKLFLLYLYVRLTTLWVCVCPTSISMFEQTIDRQKFSRIMDRSDRIYLKEKNTREKKTTILEHFSTVCFTHRT